MAAKINWHRYGTKLRHYHLMYMRRTESCQDQTMSPRCADTPCVDTRCADTRCVDTVWTLTSGEETLYNWSEWSAPRDWPSTDSGADGVFFHVDELNCSPTSRGLNVINVRPPSRGQGDAVNSWSILPHCPPLNATFPFLTSLVIHCNISQC